MTLLSARHWTATKSSWRALVFCLWLVSFVSAFALGDCLHTATCPDQGALKWATHSTHTFAHSSAHIVTADIECAASALQNVDWAFFAVIGTTVVFLTFTLFQGRFLFTLSKFVPILPIARGPPLGSSS